MRRNGSILWVWLALLLTVRSGIAEAESVHMAGRVVFVRNARIARFTAVSPTGGSFALEGDPTLVGGRITFLDADDPDGNDVAYALPVQASPFGWRAIATGGYRYRGKGTVDDPCRVVLLKRRVLKAACRGAGVTLRNPISGELHVALTIGDDTDRYCAAFGGDEIRNDDVMTKRASAPPKSACSCGAVPPTELRFGSRAPSGVCGGLTTTSDPVDLDCGKIYFGGGQVGTPPFVVTDMEDPTTLSVDCCSDETLILGPSSAASSGAKSCSQKGCPFGPPLVVPNPNQPQSVCVYPMYTEDARGTARCDTGEVRVTLPIRGEAYLTGDILPRRCSGGSSPGLRCGGPLDPMAPNPLCPGGGTCQLDPTLQPCPICNTTTGVCNGGMNNGLACVPGSDEVAGPMYPTSRDCPVSTLVKVADIPLPLSLTTGTSAKTSVDLAGQQRIFCGFCRDPDTTAFEQVSPGVARPCTSNEDCKAPYTRCQQRNGGAFAEAATSITAVGSPAGNIEDFGLHDATLVSVFCLTPTFVAIIDAPSDLPGPGAATFQGRLQLGSPGGAFLDAFSSPAARW